MAVARLAAWRRLYREGGDYMLMTTISTWPGLAKSSVYVSASRVHGHVSHNGVDHRRNVFFSTLIFLHAHRFMNFFLFFRYNNNLLPFLSMHHQKEKSKLSRACRIRIYHFDVSRSMNQYSLIGRTAYGKYSAWTWRGLCLAIRKFRLSRDGELCALLMRRIPRANVYIARLDRLLSATRHV